MKQCEFCGAIVPDTARFCGKCGHVPSQISQKATLASNLPTALPASASNDEHATILTPSGRLGRLNTSTGPLHPVTLIPIPDEEENEEEEQRRAALLGPGIAALNDLANQPTLGQVPGVQGTPQIAHVPSISGTPATQGGAPSLQTSLQSVNPPPQLLPRPPHSPSGHSGSMPGGSTSSPAGCLTVGAIIAASLLIILAMVIGLGLTVFAPQLSLSGSTSVSPGSTLTLHGSSFLPNSSVVLTLDGGMPLYVLQQRSEPARNTQYAASAETVLLSPLATNIVPVQGDGTFNLSFQVNPTWAPGQHIIHATESFSHRSAALTFTIIQPGASIEPTATPTDTPTPTPTPTATATPIPTPTAAPPPVPTLSCITPGTLALGPASEFSSQAATGSITLCASGSGTLTWRASWDQKHAPWLHMAQDSGSVQAPRQFQATISASAANLAAGTYTATITFIGVESNTTQALNITFAVKAGCIRAEPLQMSFTATIGSDPNPATQNISITNCGLTSDWSASATTTDKGNWLSISPGKGTLQGGTGGTIAVTVASANLPANSYTGSVTITLGSMTVTVTISLTVQSPPVAFGAASSNLLDYPCASNPGGNGDAERSIRFSANLNSAALNWPALSHRQ